PRTRLATRHACSTIAAGSCYAPRHTRCFLVSPAGAAQAQSFMQNASYPSRPPPIPREQVPTTALARVAPAEAALVVPVPKGTPALAGWGRLPVPGREVLGENLEALTK